MVTGLTLCTSRQISRLSAAVFDGDSRPYINIVRFTDHPAYLPGNLIPLFLHGTAFQNITKFDSSRDLSDDGYGKGVPFNQDLIGFNPFTIANP